MELKEAKKYLEELKPSLAWAEDVEAIDTVLQELEQREIDLTTVHIKGVCDEKSRWRNKIKEKIEEVNQSWFDFLGQRDVDKTIQFLEELLKGE